MFHKCIPYDGVGRTGENQQEQAKFESIQLRWQTQT